MQQFGLKHRLVESVTIPSLWNLHWWFIYQASCLLSPQIELPTWGNGPKVIQEPFQGNHSFGKREMDGPGSKDKFLVHLVHLGLAKIRRSSTCPTPRWLLPKSGTGNSCPQHKQPLQTTCATIRNKLSSALLFFPKLLNTKYIMRQLRISQS